MKNKKSLIIISILLILVLLIFIGYFIYNKYFCYTKVSSINNSFSINMPNRIKYKIKDNLEENYPLYLYSVKDEMFIYSSVIDKQADINLNEVVTKEKDNLNSNLQNINIVSDVSDLTINNYKACKYTYTYSDANYNQKKDLYAEVVWIETDSKVYIFDLEVISKNMKKYIPLFEQIENSFNEHQN